MAWRKKSFEVLPALAVRRQALRGSLRTVTAAWMVGVVWMACVSGAQTSLFGRMLGFNNLAFGLLAAIPCAATAAQLIAAVMIERTGLRKYQFLYFGTIHRLLWIAMAAIGVLLQPGTTTVVLFLCTYGVSSALGHMMQPAWSTWMGDLIPRRIRGRYFANRRIWTIPVQIAVAILSGLLLDYATRPAPAVPAVAAISQPASAPTAEAAASQPASSPVTAAAPAAGAPRQTLLLWTIAGLFTVGGLCGAIDILLFRRVREMASVSHAPARPRFGWMLGVVSASVQVLVEAFRDRVFRHYALYLATLQFGICAGGQFFFLYTLENVGYSKLWTHLCFLVFSSLTSFNVVRIWGTLIDRWGRRPILMFCTSGVVFSTVGWFLIVPGHPYLNLGLGIATCVLGGAMWSGVDLAQTSIVMGFAERPGRSRLVAAAAVIAAMGGFLGGLTGGYVAEKFKYLQASPLHVGPFEWNNYHLVFAISSVFRALSVLWLIRMPDPGSRPFGAVVHDITVSAYGNVSARLLWPLRMIRRRGDRPN